MRMLVARRRMSIVCLTFLWSETERTIETNPENLSDTVFDENIDINSTVIL